MGRTVFFIAVVIFFQSWLPGSVASGTRVPMVTLSKTQYFGQPSSLFSCYDDRVYAFLDLPKKTAGENMLEGYWYRPDGKVQEHTQVPVKLKAPGERRFYMWLKFHLERVNLEDMILPQFEDEVFDGEWKVEVFWNKQKVGISTFTVRCV